MISDFLYAWGTSRLPLVALLVLVCGLAVGGGRDEGTSWEALLAPSGVRRVTKVHWLVQPGPGRWGSAVAEVIPGGPGQDSVENHHDILLFDGMLDGNEVPLRVRRVGNLTTTPHADDRILDQEGPLLVTAADVAGQTARVDLFDLRGDPRTSVDEEGIGRSWGDRFKLSMTNAQARGRAEGVGRISYVLAPYTDVLTGRLDGRFLVLQGAGSRFSSVSLHDGEVQAGLYPEELGLERQSRAVVVVSWTQFTVNRLRAAPWFGASRIAAVEKYVFDRVDGLRTAWESVVGADTSALAEEVGGSQGPGAPPPISPLQMEDSVVVGPPGVWPPANIALPGGEWGFERVDGEGVWRPWVPQWRVSNARDGRPWSVVRTAVRVNRRRPSDFVTMVAMDMRQLELFLQAGSAHPRATTGFRGTGQIPRDASILSRLVLGFNGGFKTSHGAFGMTLDRRMFIPVKPAMATVGFFEDGSVRMGTWPGRAPLGHYRKEQKWQMQIARRGEAPDPPPEVVSLRQNLPPLVSAASLNPGGARRWGGPVANLSHTTTPRSGLCVAPPATLVYVWAARSSASDIGNGMILAGCEYGMHLDMNPYHTGMSMYGVPILGGKVPPDVRGHGPEGSLVERASQQMNFDDRRYLARDVKDFFYVLRRRLLTDRLGPPPPGMSEWSSRGLPLELGVRPLAVVSRSKEGAFLLAIDRTMISDVPAETGGVRVVFEAAEEPRTLARGGDWLKPLPSFRGPVVRAQTAEGDVVFAGCDDCDLPALVVGLQALGVERADVVGQGGVSVDALVDDQWRPVVAVPYPGEPSGEFVFGPGPVVIPLGTTDFASAKE
jgi:hypothetical protein